MTIRIGMWSGPRNISTAMMRAWENRPDCIVIDEPFYACYLQETGSDHPMREAVIASQSTDWSVVANHLSSSACAADVFYQKLLTHQMLDHVDLGWTRELRHCFLVRDPVEVVHSYAQKRDSITVDDIGITRQLALFDELSDITGQKIPVIDARKFLENPARTLRQLCNYFNIPFFKEMLHWPAGRRESDGVWAPHWYQAVEQSTGFEPYKERNFKLDSNQQRVAADCEVAYRTLLGRGTPL